MGLSAGECVVVVHYLLYTPCIQHSLASQAALSLNEFHALMMNVKHRCQLQCSLMLVLKRLMVVWTEHFYMGRLKHDFDSEFSCSD